ncbi:histidine kinase-like protein [Saccharothrix carnea]|uniref:Histidine kinase-like protein n=1 Tax=Saccharothrix carnea TaxID=1280637 RepID=A0A2P8IFK5_SACCR|nr:histidine kinase [Saccharothrix carnea]PSL57242.1 histidine kinase-like protein [Saccharothrix carnea]
MPKARADDVTAGGLLADRRAEILVRLEARLRDSGSLLGKDPAVLPECLARADAILTATVTDLARSAPPVQQQPQQPVTPPGGTGVLMDVVLAELLRVAAEQPQLVPDLAAVLTVLHRNLASQVHAIGDSYDTSILRTADEARRRERRQLAREVHDQLGHELSIAMHQLELVELYEAADDRAAAAKRISGAREHLSAALSIVRQLITEFSDGPAALDLEQEIVAFADTAGAWRTVVHVKVTGNQRLVPDRHRKELFLILREALLNVFAHAAAEKAVVLVDITSETITASVEDDGIGFDPARAAARQGFGLVSMRERAGSLGGSCVVTATATGSRVDVELPLP